MISQKNRTDLKETKKRTRWGWKGYPFHTSTKNRRGNQTGDRLGKGLQKIKEGPKSFSQSPELNHPQPPITTNPRSHSPITPSSKHSVVALDSPSLWHPGLSLRASDRQWTRRITSTNLECRFALIDTCSDSVAAFVTCLSVKREGVKGVLRDTGLLKCF